MSERLILYVDGFNLYHGLHDAAGCRLLWLDLWEVGRRLRPHSDLVAVKYFTAPVLNEPAAASRQQVYQDALRARAGERLTITQGRYQAKPKKCRSCGAKYRTYEEKETDVNIASNLIEDAANAVTDSAIIVSGDSDLLPGIKTAQRLNPDQTFIAAFPPKRRSDEVRRYLPGSFRIGQAIVRQSQLPDSVTDERTGKTFVRPDKWR